MYVRNVNITSIKKLRGIWNEPVSTYYKLHTGWWNINPLTTDGQILKQNDMNICHQN